MTDTRTPDIGQCLSEGWALYKQEPLLLSGATLLMALIQALGSLVPFAGLLLYVPLVAGLYLMIIRIDRGEPVVIAHLFDGFKQFVPLVLSSLLTSVLITLGLFLFLLPGLYLIMAYGFTTLIIADEKRDFWPAMEASRKTVNRHFWTYSLLASILFFLCVLGSIPFGLGLLVAVPVCLAAQYRFYRALTEPYDAEITV